MQNEIYVALSHDEKKMYGCTPDIITMVDPKTGMWNTNSIIGHDQLCLTMEWLIRAHNIYIIYMHYSEDIDSTLFSVVHAAI